MEKEAILTSREVKSKAKKKVSCPECSSNNLEKEICGNNIHVYMALVCQDCGEELEVKSTACDGVDEELDWIREQADF